MSTPIIALLRHGDYHQPENVPSAMLPYALTRKGRGQAKEGGLQIARYLDDYGLSLVPTIDCSHMLRAWETAAIISDTLHERLGVPIAIDEFDALAERGVGSAANLTVDEIEQILDDDPRYPSPPSNWKSSSDYRLPFQGAESLLDAGERVAAHLRRVIEQTPSTSLKVVVGHGASIRHAALHLGIFKAHEVGLYSMYHAAPILLTFEAGRWHQIAGDWKLRQREDGSDEFRDPGPTSAQ